MCYSFSQTAPCNSVAPKCKVTICPQVDGSALTINAQVLHTDTVCHDAFVSVLSCISMPHSLKSSCFLFFPDFSHFITTLMFHHFLCNLSSYVLSSFGLTGGSLSFIYILQLVNEEEAAAQSSQEGSAQEAPPPYSSIAAANAGNR